ncbi:pseudouridine synthase [Verminephrobacter aporrectodeae]|uniref:pseudouridine synthase n=1 Tax=Verminephrobacter aporrectodeae TaxID=1110389 RepID=UPI002242C673|nr:pseudouridine synthase [Verminephrobacter aporrectodeae]MCW8163801.1 pseudouridine synthase [Verminephrobacter aporrectodeae subsp. tuberculatae]MCW8168036.1 pseudouridine synthase [Verminephrobacter aporrectodeae subsp. tuberculatae]MCW8176007.1 pseudouridine synthase [Verminephrobacter aporrectodeae subsp. tuberculatae]MCW8203704.1 pseudouridine synthase [Verminephrobacter aporrectodeae subsp. tuberculatae]
MNDSTPEIPLLPPEIDSAAPPETRIAVQDAAAPDRATTMDPPAGHGAAEEPPADAGSGPREHRADAQAPRDRKPRPEGPRREPHRSAAPAGYQFEDVVSGRFDEDDAAPSVPPAKRILQPQVETPKLHKVLAQAGLGSRIEMEQLILEGRISVNNEPAHIGQRIQFGDQVKVNGQPIRYRIDPPPARVIAYHKPAGEVVTHDDPQNRPTVFRKLPRLVQGKWQSVGRLDLNTEGLLLFTSSGELANRLMHPRFGLEREYAVRVLGALSNEEKQKLLDGVHLDDGVACFGSIEEGGGEGANCWYRVTLSEGRNREVRRMLESMGHAVSRLIRIRYGAMVLPRGLRRGAWLELDEGDIRALAQAAGAGQAGAGPGAGARAANKQRNRPRMGAAPLRDRPQDAAAGGPRGQKPWRNGAGPGARSGNAGGAERQRAAAQPDPMKTSVGYIGGDSLSRHRQDKRRPGGGGGPRRGGGR